MIVEANFEIFIGGELGGYKILENGILSEKEYAWVIYEINTQ